MNNMWIYFALHSDCVTNRDLLIGKLQIQSGCKGFTTSVLLQASYAVKSNVTFKGGDLLIQNPNKLDCCKEPFSGI
jgi:hypothetical protein